MPPGARNVWLQAFPRVRRGCQREGVDVWGWRGGMASGWAVANERDESTSSRVHELTLAAAKHLGVHSLTLAATKYIRIHEAYARGYEYLELPLATTGVMEKPHSRRFGVVASVSEWRFCGSGNGERVGTG